MQSSRVSIIAWIIETVNLEEIIFYTCKLLLENLKSMQSIEANIERRLTKAIKIG